MIRLLRASGWPSSFATQSTDNRTLTAARQDFWFRANRRHSGGPERTSNFRGALGPNGRFYATRRSINTRWTVDLEGAHGPVYRANRSKYADRKSHRIPHGSDGHGAGSSERCGAKGSD